MQLVETWYASEAWGLSVAAGLLEEDGVSLTSHLVENHSCYMNVCAKGFESVDDGGCAVCDASCVDHENDGDVEDGSYFCCAAEVSVVTVEESHHSFYHVHCLGIVCKDLLQVLFAGEV